MMSALSGRFRGIVENLVRIRLCVPLGRDGTMVCMETLVVYVQSRSKRVRGRGYHVQLAEEEAGQVLYQEIALARSGRLLLGTGGQPKDHVYVFSKEIWVTAFWTRLAAAAAAALVKTRRGPPLVSVCGFSASLGLNSRYAAWPMHGCARGVVMNCFVHRSAWVVGTHNLSRAQIHVLDGYPAPEENQYPHIAHEAGLAPDQVAIYYANRKYGPARVRQMRPRPVRAVRWVRMWQASPTTNNSPHVERNKRGGCAAITDETRGSYSG